jgi:hypothetical protein
MSTGFGQWYEDKKAAENGGGDCSSSSSSSFDFGADQILPLFQTESIMSMGTSSWNSMKESMEATMPKKVMGMGYQQRFKVRNEIKMKRKKERKKHR